MTMPDWGRSTDVDELWPALLAGHLEVLSYSEDRDLEVVLGARCAPFSGHEVRRSRASRIAEQVLLGESQKAVAAGRGVATSTVGGILRGLFSAMRVTTSATRVPLALVLLAYAAHGRDGGALRACARRLDAGRVSVSVVGRERLLLGEVSRSERDVAVQFLEGRSYRQIARRRGTSVRTVANQIRAVFRALGVSGRYELLRLATAQRPTKLATVATSSAGSTGLGTCA